MELESRSSLGSIIAIFVAPTRRAEQLAVEAVQLKMGKGLVGDRFFGRSQKIPGRNITFIEVEEIYEFNQSYQQAIELNATRRNFITRGIRLNELVGKTFRVGDVLCRGVELCEPCRVLARQLPQDSLTQTQIIKAFTNKGGLRADVLSDGIVRLGDSLS
ncbi:MAG: sulfurase [Proteobacteria bacterium]|nr:sulfurase [Pseudomonadota bacterium]